MSEQGFSQWRYKIQYLQHWIAIWIRQCCFETGKYCLIVLVKVKLLRAHFRVFYFISTVSAKRKKKTKQFKTVYVLSKTMMDLMKFGYLPFWNDFQCVFHAIFAKLVRLWRRIQAIGTVFLLEIRYLPLKITSSCHTLKKKCRKKAQKLPKRGIKREKEKKWAKPFFLYLISVRFAWIQCITDRSLHFDCR